MKIQKLLSFMLSLIILCTLSCGSEKDHEGGKKVRSNEITERIGPDAFHSLKEGHRVAMMKVKPSKTGAFDLDGETTVVSDEMTQKLIKVLSDDESYIFDMTKKCLFIPEYAFQFQGEDNLLILFSPQCKQVKFIISASSKNPVLDIDPSYDALMSIIKGKEGLQN